MKLKPFRPQDLEAFPGQPLLNDMTGLTLRRDDGTIVMCGGTILCPWGDELWICVREDATRAEKIRIGRTARSYVKALLEERADIVWTSASEGQDRWLKWLGFELDHLLKTQGVEVQRWRMTSGKAKAWA